MSVDVRLLQPDEPLPDLSERYRWPDGRGWLRCMMLTTLDGAARGHDGLSGSLSGEADQDLFRHVRRFAHAVLIGAGTMRAERYQPLAAGEDAPARIAAGLHPAPVLVIVTASLELPWEDPVFSQSAIDPIVVTTEAALARVRPPYDVIALEGDRVNPFELISELARRGLTHIVCEGGPRLLSELVRVDLVDEADISISPVIAGGGQIVTGLAMASPPKLILDSVIVRDNWIFTRYLRVR